MGLREYLEELEKSNPADILRIASEVEPRYEISAAGVLLEKHRQNPVLLFERVKDSPFPVAVNVMGSKARLAAALGVSPPEFGEAYLKGADRPLAPVEVSDAPVKEVKLPGRKADVLKLPQITHHANDAGPYITCGIALARDPETGKYNASFNRLMIKGPRKLGICMTPGRHLREIYMRYREMGRPLPLAVAVGLPPLYALGAVYAGPHDADEIEIIGGLMGAPVPLVRCETIDLLAPAEAEIIIEGEVPQDVLENEGPLAEFTGYSSGEKEREIFEIKAITHRRKAIFQDITPGRREMFLLSASVQEACLKRMIAGLIPNLSSLRVPAPFTLFISIRNRAEGQAKQAILAGLAAEFYMKTVVVFDDDIDILNDRDVWWAMSTRMQADRDLFIIPRALGAELDPSCLREGMTAKMGLDATAKPTVAHYAPRNRMPQEVLERLERSGFPGSSR